MKFQKKIISLFITVLLATTVIAFQNCGKKSSSSPLTEEDLDLKAFVAENSLQSDGDISTSSMGKKNKEDKNIKNGVHCPPFYQAVYKNKVFQFCQAGPLSGGNVPRSSYEVCKRPVAGGDGFDFFAWYSIHPSMQCIEVTSVGCPSPKLAYCGEYAKPDSSCTCEIYVRCASGKYDPVAKRCL